MTNNESKKMKITTEMSSLSLNFPHTVETGVVNGEWSIEFGPQLWGGDAILYCKYCDTTAQLHFKIGGTNPSYGDISTYLVEDKYRALCWQESKYIQFKRDFMPEGAGKPEGGSIGMPLPNQSNDGGYGLMQITYHPLQTYSDCWNWKYNATAGSTQFADCYSDAVTYCEESLRNIAPTQRYLPEEYVLKEAWTRYNGGNNAHYWKEDSTTPIEIDGEMKHTLVEHMPHSDAQDHADAVWGYYVSKPWEE